MSARPLVWVVTPVYNGERFLRETIESVIPQTYDEWRYVIVDNCSTDRTAEIAADYAARDERISLSHNGEFRSIIANWNHALELLPADAKYCKVVHADDTLFPECLERMVGVAESDPRVGIVTSYAMWGDDVRHEGVPYPQEIVSGREICRAALEGRSYVFGSPTSVLIRADLVRERAQFYNEENFHADTEACFDLLRTTDLGFVHQVLTRTRLHDESMAPLGSRINTFHGGWLTILTKYGASYLEPEEYRRQLARRFWRYGVFLAKALVRGKFRDARFRSHHRTTVGVALRSHGRRVVCLPPDG